MDDNTSHVANLVAGEIKCVLHDPTGRILLEAYVCFSRDFKPCTFPFTDFIYYLFPVINHSFEYDCMFSPMSPPSKSLNLGAPGDPQHNLK